MSLPVFRPIPGTTLLTIFPHQAQLAQVLPQILKGIADVLAVNVPNGVIKVAFELALAVLSKALSSTISADQPPVCSVRKSVPNVTPL